MKKTITSLKRFVAGVFLLAAVPSVAQVATTYTFAQAAGTYTNVTGGTILASAALANMDDEVFGPLTIPAFSYDGNVYTSIYVNTNGYISFGASDATEYTPISGTLTYPGAIAAFGTDLDQASSGTRNIRAQLIGTEYVVQWQNVARYAITGERISFQIRLNTATNQIKIVYGGTITPGADTDYPEVGLRGPDNTFASNVNNRKTVAATGAWVNSTAGTASASTCYFNSATAATVPAVGTTFTWTPGADLSVTGIVAPGTAGCLGKTETVSIALTNLGGTVINFATTPVTVNVASSGPNPTVFTPVTISTGTLAINASQTVTVSTSYNMSVAGTYLFNVSAPLTGDVHAANNTATLVRQSHTPLAAYPNATVCSGQSATLSGTATAYPFVLTQSNTTALAIPDNTAAGVNSTIVISGAGSTPAATVSAAINRLTHTFTGDLVLKLTAPNGSSVILANQEGFDADFTNTVFSDAATTPISAGSNPYTGAFNPESPLSGLTGLANGTWTLNVADVAAADVGTLQGWTLAFNVANSISTYSWSPATGLSSASIASPVASPAASTLYLVTVTDLSGCSNTDSVQLTVNPLPAVVANVTAAAICDGGSVTFSGSGANTYTWTGGVVDGEAYMPAATSTYTVTGTDGNGCMNTATASVTVNTLPAVAANASASAVCTGGDVTFTGSGASTYTWTNGVMDGVAYTPATTATYTVTGTDGNGCMNTATASVTVNTLPTVAANTSAAAVCTGGDVTFSGSGAATYTWTSGVMDGVAYMPAATATYTVTGTDVNGCMNTATTTVTVNTLPVVTGNASTAAICDGGSVIFSGSGADTYSWTGGVVDGEAYTPAATNTYTVTGTDVNGCMNTATTSVTVNILPAVAASASAAAVCAGGDVTFTGSGAATYTWTNGVMDGVAYTPAATATYTVTGTDVNGCMNTSTTTVTVNALPAVGANVTAVAVCNGSDVTFTGSGASIYTWSSGVSNGVAYTPAATATYTVTGTDANGCMNTASTTVTVNMPPTVNVNFATSMYCIADAAFTLSGASPAGGTWSGNGVSGSTFDPAAAGTGASVITYMYTDANGCAASDTASITVDMCTGIATVGTSNLQLNAYPNPTSDVITLTVSNSNATEIVLEITDMIGKTVYSQRINNGGADYTTQIDVSSFAKGTYLLRVSSNTTLKMMKIVKQ